MTSDFERDNWNEYYNAVLKGESQQNENTLWWQVADRDALRLIKLLFEENNAISLLEAGCGSGANSLCLLKFFSIKELYLLDISEKALKVAQKHTDPILADKITYIEGDIFDLSCLNKQFDLVWNTGVLEHYEISEIQKIVSQMYSKVKLGGYLVVGIPNRKSIAVLKAALLGSSFGKKYLFWFKGYRNTSEILYSNRVIKEIIKKVTGKNAQIQYGGSLLWVGAFNFLIRFIDLFFKRTRFSFLSYFFIRKC